MRDAEDAIDIEQVTGQVTFEGVEFAYPGRRDTIAATSRSSSSAGASVAIVGPTGAGKTTLVWLLARFYDPSAGRILLDGVDLRKIRLDALRRQMSIVLQEPLLFSGTIAENIRYGRLDATDDGDHRGRRGGECRTSSSAVCPSGYDTVLGERGTRLSGGERQRLSIARAFLKNAPILILDEPTSSIDSRTEAIILDALERLSEGRTTFTIAHRLSTIRRSDQILVIDKGHLIESGTHERLLAGGGLYRELWEAQTGGRRDPQSGPLNEAVAASAALVHAVRLLLAAGTADLGSLAVREGESDDVREAAAVLAQLTPEQLDALRDLDDRRLAALVVEAVRPAPVFEAVL